MAPSPRIADPVDPRPHESPHVADAVDSRRSGGFPRSARVRAKAEFSRVFADGRRSGNAVLAVHFLADDLPPRLGLAVSRKVDRRAVGRNRIKRAMRERFRHLRAQLAPGAYVVVARSGAREADAGALNEALESLLRRLRALPAPPAGGTMPRADRANARDSSPPAPTSDDSGVTTLPAS